MPERFSRRSFRRARATISVVNASLQENVSGVRKVHDHLVWLEPMSGVYVNSAEDERDAKAG